MSDDFFMERACTLALNGLGKTSPNPCVGAVIVKDGKIIAEGWHQKAGADHAEVVAIGSAKSVKGATLFVTLEPCCHLGKTPPCTDLIVETGIVRVVVGMIDPFGKVCGKGVEVLKKAGVKVEIYSGDLEMKIRNLNQPFVKVNSTGIPYVILKAGVSFDGKIATADGHSKWITDDVSREDSKRERALCDAVLVGFGTVQADDPVLDGAKRIIFDKKLELDLKKKVFRDKNVFVACTDLASRYNRKRFEKAGISFKSFGKGRISISSFLRFLGKSGIQSLFVEGGAGIHGAFYDAFLKNPLVLDRVVFYIAPKILGGNDALSAIGGRGLRNLAGAPEFREFNCEKLKRDLKIEGFFNFY